ncbi:hypothetical protein CHLRE_09g388134v5 [Chlamydomonas reinhardtii]|uniref:O-fucosyltransferase family protein n=1 Tax=Chlamydomonas reinhardtii TaxID=3055 RepID=A0A2K3DDW5_CHLRE|nr:uncharacterized protein CHLRE_09g388134v5 [Chlamydomonas reinhardtii]PNW78728.1 hypothetical protein CHLRE_09g388134v5 [Chlamydomonas reinhardtii]
MCLKNGVTLARALQRVLVLPVFTDVEPVVDVSKYVSLDCFRRSNQAVTYQEFRGELCRGVGLGLPEHAVASGGSESASSHKIKSEGGDTSSFCEDGALLQLETSYSLADYRGYTCWARREDITNARDLGITIKGCKQIDPANITVAGINNNNPYPLEYVKRTFADRPEKVLLFLDLFGVNLLPDVKDLAETVSQPEEMCGWMPAEQAAAAADAVMQTLIPLSGDTRRLSTGTQHSVVASAVAASPGAQPLMRLRGTRRYMAVHLRRSDWFYYCAGARKCFYSMTEVGAWLNETLAQHGLNTLYASTNADEREKQMLRRAVSGRVLFWEDVVSELLRWQAGATPGAGGDILGSGTSQAGDGEALASASGVEVLPEWLRSIPLDDALMVQMVEKAICMQAASFISSSGSTFSNQIRDFRDGGLDELERNVLMRKFGAATITAAVPTVADGKTVAAAVATEPHESATYLCNEQMPALPDTRRYPDFHNPNIFLEQAKGLWARIKYSLGALWQAVGGSSSSNDPSAVTAKAVRIARPPTLGSMLAAPFRLFERWVLIMEDAHALAAANRFVEMYTGGAVASLVLEGRQDVPVAALVECVVAEASRAGALALHVAMLDVPEQQQVLIMQQLEAARSLAQVTRMGGAAQERGNTFTMLWRGDGLGRRAEPALLEELPVFLEHTDVYVLAKGRVLLGDPRSGLFRQVANTRRLFGFQAVRDGACAPAALRAASGAVRSV